LFTGHVGVLNYFIIIHTWSGRLLLPSSKQYTF